MKTLEKYIKVYIKSESDLPKLSGRYWCKEKEVNILTEVDFTVNNEGDICNWIDVGEYYLLPVQEEINLNIKDFVKKFMQSYEPDTFIPNKHGQYVYRSENGASGLNLVVFFEDLLEEYRSQPSDVSDEEIEKLLIDYESYCQTFVSKDLIKNYIKQRNNGK